MKEEIVKPILFLLLLTSIPVLTCCDENTPFVSESTGSQNLLMGENRKITTGHSEDNTLVIPYEILDPATAYYESSFKEKISSGMPELSIIDSNSAKQVSCMIEPSEVIEVASPVQGIIDDVMVDRGDYVKTNQIIATLKKGLEEVNVDLYQTRLIFREQVYERMHEVYKKKFVSSDDYDQIVIERDIAKYELAREIELLDMKTIKTPLSGYIIDKYFSSGEYVETQAIVRIAKIDPLNVEVTVPLSMLGDVKVGDEARVYLENNIKEVPLLARIDIIDRNIDPASGTFGIRLILPNPRHSIPSGIRCGIKWVKKSVM